ncbi:type II secretion system major pseudopilin GspG [Sphingomonas qomolangmaensis]|nr:type II secretion system major pseudopilin GspG [Sphingomonas qomolangmaensis]
MRILLKQFHDSRRARGQSRARTIVENPNVAENEAGLTLVEMIVVLAIIALVAALIVPNVIGRPDEARVTVANTDIRTISAALKMYRLDNGSYPTTAQGLKALAEKPTTPPIPSSWSSEGYLGQVPEDPWGNPYSYASPAPGGFALKSLGKDGQPGGEGLDADLTGGK